jgi:WD40 repeat protein
MVCVPFIVSLQDFNSDGSRIVSCGMDHSLKIWSLKSEEIASVCVLSLILLVSFAGD